MLENRTLATRVDSSVDEGGIMMPATGAAAAAMAGRAPERSAPSILTIIWRRRWVFVGCILIALACAAGYLYKAVPIYSSSSQIVVQQSAPKMISDVLNSGQAAANYLFTQCDIIRSTAIITTALEAPEVRQAKALRSVDNPVAFLRGSTSATVGKQSDVITVTVEGQYPEDCALLVNAVVDAYITYQNKQQRTSVAEVLKILQKEKDKHEQELQKTNKAMLEFKRANGMLSFESEKGNVIIERLSDLSEAVTKAQMDVLDAKVLLDAATALSDDPVKFRQLMDAERMKGGATAAPGDNGDLWNDYRRLHSALELAREKYGPDYESVRSMEKQLAALKKEMSELDGATAENYRAVLQQQYLKAKQKEEELTKAMAQQRSLAMDLNAKAAEYTQLESDARRAEKWLENLETRIKEMNFAEDTPTQISILEVGRPKNTPDKPQRSKTFGMAMVIGVLCGLAAALLQDWMDQRMRSVEEIRSVLELPVLGIIPHMLGKLEASQRGQEVHLKPRSNVAEAYRTVRTAIYFGVPDPKSRTLLVTSPSPGDGKTTSASNLAIAIAQSGRRVLLIDADCRKPMMHRIFNMTDEVGLSSVLLNAATPEQAIQASSTENLDVLPCGPIPPNPSEILNSQGFLDLINALALKYDQIVIDSPPVEPVTDARILAANCDVTVLVLRAEKSTRRLSAHARDALIGVGANLLGCVVNDVPRGQDGYSYYSGYGYYHYGYGRSSGNGGNGNGSSGGGSGNGSRREVKAITVGTDA